MSGRRRYQRPTRWLAWEAVFQAQGRIPLGQSDESFGVGGVGVLLKHVLREGSLQDRSGPSVATEFGVLLPGVGTEPGVGATVSGIVSQRFEWTTLHLNATATLTRDQHADGFLHQLRASKPRPAQASS